MYRKIDPVRVKGAVREMSDEDCLMIRLEGQCSLVMQGCDLGWTSAPLLKKLGMWSFM